MAVHATDFAVLVETAERGIADLRRAIQRVPSHGDARGAQFVAAAEALLAAIEKGLNERKEEFAEAVDEVDQESLVRALRQITHDIRNVHSTTPWIEAAQHVRLPLGLVYLIDEVALALVQKNAYVIAVPSAEYMYSTQHKPFSLELSALQHEYPADALPIIVHYPAQELPSLLLHLVIAHELGHSAIIENDLIQAVAARVPEKLQKQLGRAGRTGG